MSDERKHIAINPDGTRYRDPHGHGQVNAYWLSVFVERFVSTSRFDINDVDGALLETALEP